MEYLFTRAGLAKLRGSCGPRTLFALDYDGTLAGIVPVRSEARMTPETTTLVARLIERATVAVISGRSAADVSGFLPARPAFVVGNHGIEGVTEPAVRDAMIEVCGAWQAALKLRLEGLTGVELEDKGYSLAVHYRRATDKERARAAILEGVSRLAPPPHLVTGKEVLNLVPRGAPNKGDAVLNLLKRTGAPTAVFVGDDDTDEDVFRLRDPRLLTIRVGFRNDSAAGYFLENQAEVDRLLMTLHGFLDDAVSSESTVSGTGRR